MWDLAFSRWQVIWPSHLSLFLLCFPGKRGKVGHRAGTLLFLQGAGQLLNEIALISVSISGHTEWCYLFLSTASVVLSSAGCPTRKILITLLKWCLPSFAIVRLVNKYLEGVLQQVTQRCRWSCTLPDFVCPVRMNGFLTHVIPVLAADWWFSDFTFLSPFCSYLSTLRKECPFPSYSRVSGWTQIQDQSPCHYLVPWGAPRSFACTHSTCGYRCYLSTDSSFTSSTTWKPGHRQQCTYSH